MSDILIELFSEEIPARMQKRAAEDLRRLVTDGLVEAGLTYGGAAAFATPRRLTLSLSGVLAESPAVREERRGPRTDAPEKAIEGFLRGAGVARDALEVRDDKKGQLYYAVIEKPGRPSDEIIAEVLTATVRNFPWPKSMRWGAGTLRWVRPLHSILCIATDEAGARVIPFEIDGIAAANVRVDFGWSTPSEVELDKLRDSVFTFSRQAFRILSNAVVSRADEDPWSPFTLQSRRRSTTSGRAGSLPGRCSSVRTR